MNFLTTFLTTKKHKNTRKFIKGCCVEVRDRCAKCHACTFNVAAEFIWREFAGLAWRGLKPIL